MALVIAEKAARIAKKFEHEVGQLAGWRIVVNTPRVWTSGGDDDRSVLVESYVSGFGELENAKKMGVKEAKKRAEWMKVAAALSHFSYALSLGEYVLCGLQGGVRKNTNGGGGELILVEATIVSKRKGGWGCRDGGKEGMELFFKRHVCSEFCDRMPLLKDHKVFFRPNGDKWLSC